METKVHHPTALRPECDQDEGKVLLVHKPKGWTSFDVVNRLRGLLHVKKAGHAGTLDPMATGLLIVCTGTMTKQIDQFLGLEKEYSVHMKLGARTPSFDAETEIVERRSTEGITEDEVRRILGECTGHRVQIPPMWSAAKVGGRRLYKYARRGEFVERKPREIYIRSIVPNDIAIPDVHMTVVCSKGTYIRSLVDEIGQRLGCGAYVCALERTRIGEFRLSEAVTLEQLASTTGKLQHRSL